jgi:hypothetical protein
VEHGLRPAGPRLLEQLSTPKRLADLAAEWNGTTGLDPEREVAALREQGLVFQEGERFLSLVLPSDAASAHATAQNSAASPALVNT